METFKQDAGISKKTLAAYDQRFEKYIAPAIGNTRMKDVRDVHLQRILNSQAGMSFSHVSQLRSTIKAIFSKARKSRLILFDPSEDLTLPANEKRSRRAITDAERAGIRTVAETHRAGLWVLTMLYTGMRPGETAALQWRDVDFDANEIHVYKARESGGKEIKGPKTASGIRDIPIHGSLRPKLLAAKGDPFEPIFPTQSGNYRDDKSLSLLWASFRRALDIEMGATLKRNQIVESVLAADLTPYCLRHTFCTDLEAAGVPINVAKVLMGHSDISVTANIYTHKNKSVLHGGISKLDGSACDTPRDKKHIDSL